MNAAVDVGRRKVLVRAVHQAVRAPSVHNTQPWRFAVGADRIELFADRSRQLTVIDPTGRELLISCGAALFNLRVALAAAGYDVTVRCLPDPAAPDLLARLDVRPAHRAAAQAPVYDDGAAVAEREQLAELDPYIVRRQTNRRRFSDDSVPAELIATLHEAARFCGTSLIEIGKAPDRLAVGHLSTVADQRQVLDPAYRAELRTWTGDQPHRHDGVPSMVVPRVDAATPEDLPIRDFDTHGSGYLPADTGNNSRQCLLLLSTYTDNPLTWLHAGEALQHVLLQITRHGYAASPLTQIVEDPDTRTKLQELLRGRTGAVMVPQVLLRVGRAPQTPSAPRRPVEDVLTELD